MKDYFFYKLNLLKFFSVLILSIGFFLTIDYYLIDQNELIYEIIDKKKSHEQYTVSKGRYGIEKKAREVYVVDIGLSKNYKVSEKTYRQVLLGDKVALGTNSITHEEAYLKFFKDNSSYKHFYGGFYFMNGFELFFMLFFFPFQLFHLFKREKIEHSVFFIVFLVIMEIGYLYYYLFR